MSILAAWKVSALTTKIVIGFVGLMVWVWTIEVRDMGRARRGPARRILGETEIPEWTDEELNEEECL
tara:strand:+ start:148 stop:348 length:201 start_codon:yes stop_codon:yes gene_type:complete